MEKESWEWQKEGFWGIAADSAVEYITNVFKNISE